MVSRSKKIASVFTRLNKKILLAVVIVALLIAAGAYYLFESLQVPTSPLSSRTVSAAKVPVGWYEHMVEVEGAPAPTIIVLTKNAVLPYRNAGDGQYDDPQIMITSATIPSTPEDYIAQEGLSGENAKITGVSGTWSTFMGHKMFAIDLDQVGNTVMLFGSSTVYTLILSSSNPQDTNDFWKVIAFYAQPELYAGISSWKTYADPSTGFTITYPPQYAIEANPPPPSAWASRTLLQIYNPNSTSTGEFHVGPVQVTLQKQPVVADGEVYDTIVAYQNSGTAAQMVQNAPNPKGELMTIASGEQGLFHAYPANPDTGTDPIDSFTFIKNNLIYDVSFDANDPNEQAMLESMKF